MEIEVFRAGNPAAIAAGITAADLADVAAFDCATNPVPNVIGHPATEDPACASVVRFRAEGNSLFADVPETHAAFKPVLDGIKGGTILGRSMAFFGPRHPSNPTPGKLAPKHLGFLGGAVPGIPGLPPLSQTFAFSADDVLTVTGEPADAVVFTGLPEGTPVHTFSEAAPAAQPKEPTVTEAELQAQRDQLAADRKAHDDKVTAFAADQKKQRDASTAASVAALVTARKVAPAHEADLVAAFSAIDNADVLTFADKSQATPVSKILAIIAQGPDVAPAGVTSPTDAPQFNADGGSDAKKAQDDAIAERNKRYAK